MRPIPQIMTTMLRGYALPWRMSTISECF